MPVPLFGRHLLRAVWQNDSRGCGNETQKMDLIAIALALIISFGGWVLLAMKKRRAESWPMVAGQFAQGNVRNAELQYVADIPYSYSADGSYYAGFYKRSFRSKRDAEDLIEQLKAQPVFVRYHPVNPENSVIREQDNSALFLFY